MIHGLRVYECIPGRLPDLLRRFETITLKLWDKHGIRQAGFWTTLIGANNQRLIYLLAWELLAERERKWNAFTADPDWLTARTQTEANGDRCARYQRDSGAGVVFGCTLAAALPWLVQLANKSILAKLHVPRFNNGTISGNLITPS